MGEEKKYKVCPKCGSKNISQILGRITGQLYRCSECGYYGPFIVEADSEMVEEIKKRYEKS